MEAVVSFKVRRKHFNLCDEIMKKERNWNMLARIKTTNETNASTTAAVEGKKRAWQLK